VSFLARRLVTAALTANAVRPVPGYRAGVPVFLAGWLGEELAPQLLGLTVADTALALRRGRATPAGLVTAAATSAALAHLVRQSMGARQVVEDALRDGLGVDYVDQLDAAPTPAELATPWRQVARPFRFGDPGVRVTRDLPYTDAGSRGHLDVYAPDVDDLRGAPVLLQVHGGAWTVGRKDQQGQPLLYHMAARGWVCVAVNYRLSPRDAHPAHVVDVKRALAWIREHVAEHGGDPAYVAVTGGSAGGHLAALAALTPGDPAFQPGFEGADTSVQAAVPFYGVYDWAGATHLRSAELLRDRFLAPRVVQQTWQENPEVFRRASPILRVTPDAPDFFVLHGTHDSLVDVRQARAFVDRLRSASRRHVVYAELPGAQHGFDVVHSIRGAHVVRAVDRFLTWSWNRHRRAGAAATPASAEGVVA
jgi:acetyl esterase/lipase